jgi:HipA-like C-terminal domain/HipA N-terminal domain
LKKLEVRFTREPGQERIVGHLAETGPRPAGGQVVFEYDAAFLRDPLWLSPFKLPPQPGLIEHRDCSFGPIFGLFDDSLPDGWGLLLMDRFFQQRGSALAARDAGLTMPPTRLFEAARGERFFGAERFDRRGNHRYHVHTFGNLIHANFRIPSCDYRQLLEVTRILTKNHQDVLECYRRMVFNVLTHNRDDHVKNFAFRMTDEGVWELAPAYDLVLAPGPGGEHTMTVAGEGRAPARRHLLQLAEPAGISESDADSIVAAVESAAARWRVHARQAGVDAKSAKVIEKAIGECLARL